MQFVRSPLERSEIVAQCPRNCLLEGMLERFGTFSQGAFLPFAIMETRLGGVNWHSRRPFLARARNQKSNFHKRLRREGRALRGRSFSSDIKTARSVFPLRNFICSM